MVGTKERRLQPSLGKSGTSSLGFRGEKGCLCVQERERKREMCVCVHIYMKERQERVSWTDGQVSLSGSNRGGSGHFQSRGLPDSFCDLRHSHLKANPKTLKGLYS